ncbi:hypothetical protein L6452_09552 [Arctium lappa]|uniref:Uncharacterized protein n=1 Tax=Arctium lappa TaxID=4217 RepID=A0ACB9DKP8_ARCLA|nr:hypothetical protein L6452_09552 [Arctium lappa]
MLTEQKLSKREEEEAIRRANALEQDDIGALRDDIKDEQYLFGNQKVSEAELRELSFTVYSQVSPSQVISKMGVLMTEDSNNVMSSSFLLDNDSNLVFVSDVIGSIRWSVDATLRYAHAAQQTSN